MTSTPMMVMRQRTKTNANSARKGESYKPIALTTQHGMYHAFDLTSSAVIGCIFEPEFGTWAGFNSDSGLRIVNRGVGTQITSSDRLRPATSFPHRLGTWLRHPRPLADSGAAPLTCQDVHPRHHTSVGSVTWLGSAIAWTICNGNQYVLFIRSARSSIHIFSQPSVYNSGVCGLLDDDACGGHGIEDV
jgi:hypothetical protein